MKPIDVPLRLRKKYSLIGDERFRFLIKYSSSFEEDPSGNILQLNPSAELTFNISKKDIKYYFLQEAAYVPLCLVPFIKSSFTPEKLKEFLKKNPELMEFFI